MANEKKNCPNCQGELESTEQGLFCQPCDLTFTLQKGRVKAEAGGKGAIQKHEEDIMELRAEQEKIKKALFGKNEPFWMG